MNTKPEQEWVEITEAEYKREHSKLRQPIGVKGYFITVVTADGEHEASLKVVTESPYTGAHYFKRVAGKE
jgi:hypothetical protein